MDGLDFSVSSTSVAENPARTDIACFIGFVARRRPNGINASGAIPFIQLPKSLRAWYIEHDWSPGRYGRSESDFGDLLNVPVPIESWDIFDALFGWDRRPVDGSERRCDAYIGAAVRSFFVRGGRKCYVIRLGNPWPVMASATERRVHAGDFLPVFPPVSATERASWRGIGHLYGLPDVTFLSLPDLPDICSVAPAMQGSYTGPEMPERFVECATRTTRPTDRYLRGVPGPRCDEEGFREWSLLVQRIGEFLQNPLLRQIQFVGAVPLPLDSATASGETDAARRIRAADLAQWEQAAAIQNRFVQLVYPWVRTRESALLPGNLMPADGWFTGLLANTALTRGAWESLINEPALGVESVEPILDGALLKRDLSANNRRLRLRERISVVGPTGGGMRVLSDVTMDGAETNRSAGVHRLLITILRAARITGATSVFENNGEYLWRRLRESLEGLLAAFWAEGALYGSSASEAFEVRCDRSTMTQADLDTGRVIVRVSFTAAVPIVHISVVFAMSGSGDVTLASPDSTTQPAQMQVA